MSLLHKLPAKALMSYLAEQLRVLPDGPGSLDRLRAPLLEIVLLDDAALDAAISQAEDAVRALPVDPHTGQTNPLAAARIALDVRREERTRRAQLSGHERMQEAALRTEIAELCAARGITPADLTRHPGSFPASVPLSP